MSGITYLHTTESSLTSPKSAQVRRSDAALARTAYSTPSARAAKQTANRTTAATCSPTARPSPPIRYPARSTRREGILPAAAATPVRPMCALVSATRLRYIRQATPSAPDNTRAYQRLSQPSNPPSPARYSAILVAPRRGLRTNQSTRAAPSIWARSLSCWSSADGLLSSAPQLGFLNAYGCEFGLGTTEEVANSWQPGSDDAVRARLHWTVWTTSAVGPC
jgi:hypothetical protein